MGSCIICGASVDGRVCDLHEEDVVFEFRGTEAEQLTPNRYYRGTVDGFAEFGIFVDIGDHVTGLLHKSELDRRLDSVDLDPGDTVFVQVQNVRDNGNVDLGWSIRQDESRFRGVLVDDPEAEETERLPDDAGESEQTAVKQRPGGESGPVKQRAEPASQSDAEPADDQPAESTAASPPSEPEDAGGAEAESSQSETSQEPVVSDPVTPTVSELEAHVGDRVRLEGEIAGARQTSGPTVFELRDETGSIQCAAFEEAGVRAYPEVEEGDVVRIEGEVERRRGELQVETEALVVLEDDEREAVTDRMEEALLNRARPESVESLTGEDTLSAIQEDVLDAATAIRRAVIEGRPVIVRHAATVDGYLAGVAIERATLPLIREEQQSPDAEFHYFERRPLEGSVYDMDDATRDVTSMLSDRTRHDEPFPLFVFVAAGGTTESLDGFDLLSVYGARRVVIDERSIDPGVEEAVDVLVTAPEDTDETTATVLSSTVATTVNADVREDLTHLPAVSFWEDTPGEYLDLASGKGYDEDDVARLREAVALEANYQSYEDKRELIDDLLFADDDALGLAQHISEQYRTRMNDSVETAEEHVERRDGVLVLDTEAYTHRFEFPPTPLLLDELLRRHREEVTAVFGIDTDEAYLRSDADLDVRSLVETASEQVPEAGLDARGAREGRIEFLSGERDAAREAILDVLSSELESHDV